MHEEIQKALDVLKVGGVILYPTDTVWGLGCDATNENAVKKIFEIKQRSESKSLIVLAADEHQLTRYVKDVPSIAWELMEVSERPMTIVYSNVSGLADNVIAEDKSAAIRIPKDEFCINLIRQFRKPIVSTSANISGKPAPGNFHEISKEIKSKVDYIVNHRQDGMLRGAPSSIIKLSEKGEVRVLRK